MVKIAGITIDFHALVGDNKVGKYKIANSGRLVRYEQYRTSTGLLITEQRPRHN